MSGFKISAKDRDAIREIEDHTVLEDGKLKKLYCFLFILGYSRTRYIEFVTDMSTNTLIRCHANAFRYLGGYPEEILYDNMKQIVFNQYSVPSEYSSKVILKPRLLKR